MAGALAFLDNDLNLRPMITITEYQSIVTSAQSTSRRNG